MPREGIQYWIDDTWRQRTEARLTERGWSRADLAREADCDRSLITELLSGVRHQTTYLPEIHEALGFPPPQPPLLSIDDEEILGIARGMTSEQRARLIERGLALREEKKR